VLVIGHGGSVSSSYGFCHALGRDVPASKTKNIHFLSTVDPARVMELETHLQPEHTVVLAISKSGIDTTQLEVLSQFSDFPTVAVTEKDTALYQIAQKQNWDIVEHPPIGGRFTAFTEVALLPALLSGIDIDALYRGAHEMYSVYEKDNLAFKAASVLWQLEQQGYVDVLGLVYSHYLFGTAPLATQLCHESFGKDGKGQTYLFAEAPEAQHHTEQRFLGGRKNMAGWFFGLHQYQSGVETKFPPASHSIPLRGHALFDINHIPFQESIRAELAGTLESARVRNIPILHTELTGIEPVEVGRFMAFWQLFAVYSSLLRGVNPFDQPEVEKGKEISFDKRLAYKGLL
jgi:glucose-6-phosphate isomerase